MSNLSDIEKQQKTSARASNIYTAIFIFGILIIIKVLVTQFGQNGDALREKARDLNYKPKELEAFRGDILSHDGRLLASSVPQYEIRMDFQAGSPKNREANFYEKVDSVSRCLADMFKDRTAEEYSEFMKNEFKKSKNNRFTMIAPRRVNYSEMKEISKFPLFNLGMYKSGFIPFQRYQRLLPNGSLARRTIGFTNADGVMLGIEGAFDSTLRGQVGKTMMQKISGSVRVPVADSLNLSPKDGNNVITTIDIDIQDIAETALREQIEIGQADWGCAILMEVETGDIRAIANLSRHEDGIYEDMNYAMGYSLEPGSTIKLATLINLLEVGAPLDEMYNTVNGVLNVGKGRAVVRDSHNVGRVSLETGFEQSSNIVFAMATDNYFGDREAEYAQRLKNMGLGEPLNMQIKGEAKPTIYTPEDKRMWNKTTLVNMAYGYALRLTPLHTLCLYNAVANNGKMVRPRLVTMTKHLNDTIETFPVSYMAEDICSEQTLRTVQQCLENVVTNGTAKMLQNPLYSVAAKTGTAQIAIGRQGYTDADGGRHYLASLAGYFPADNPKYSCIVVLKTYNSPKNRRKYYGSQLAGPVFKAIADRVYNTSVDWQPPIKTTSKIVLPIKGGNLLSDSISRVLGVVGQSSQQRTITNYHSNLNSLNDTLAIVPNVYDMGLRDALFIIESNGLRATVNGVGAVVEQSPQAGDTINRDTPVEITLSNQKPKTAKKK